MASRKRALLEPTDDWQQLQFQLDWPEQNRYELIRPVRLARDQDRREGPASSGLLFVYSVKEG